MAPQQVILKHSLLTIILHFIITYFFIKTELRKNNIKKRNTIWYVKSHNMVMPITKLRFWFVIDYVSFQFLVLLCWATAIQMYMSDKFKIVILVALCVNVTRTYSAICKSLSRDLCLKNPHKITENNKTSSVVVTYWLEKDRSKKKTADSAISSQNQKKQQEFIFGNLLHC